MGRPSLKPEEVERRVNAKDNLEFVGWVDYVGYLNKSIATARCTKHNVEFDSCVQNLVSDKRNCPVCIRERIGETSRKDDEALIAQFNEHGRFAPGTTYKRNPVKTDSYGRLIYWDLFCPICAQDSTAKSGLCNGVFQATIHRLLRGNIPCRCLTGKGFKTYLPGTVYILRAVSETEEFTGYGISNNPLDRLSIHRKALLKEGFSITELETFATDGIIAKEVEGLLKDYFPLEPQRISGFKKEATAYHYYDEVVAFVETQILLMEASKVSLSEVELIAVS